MSVSVTSTVPVTAPDGPITSKIEKVNSINDLLLHKADTVPNTPLVAYPASEHGCSDLAEYTSKDLDQFVDIAAHQLTRLGLVPKATRSDKTEVVALLGPSNLDYVVAMLALSRMGFAVLFLSTRLPTEAYVSLLEKTQSANIVVAPRFSSTVDSIKQHYAINTFPLLDTTIYAAPPAPGTPRFVRRIELINEADCLSWIVHSSGSTGLPKPIFQTHRACLSNYIVGGGRRAFVTLPLFHNHGLCTLFRGIVSNKRTVLYNANLPLTNANLLAAMRAADPESFHCVPYALKVLAETDEGVEALRRCKLVLFGGSSCPDDLGDKLVEAGVFVVGHYGATEMGQLMTSFRDPSDKAWNYVRPLEKVKPFLRFVPVSEGVYECVVLDGLPTKVISNSDDPPNSFYTRDTFVPHPTIPDAWKYLGRLDDRVTLVNGEKVLPIPFEHQVRQNELVQDCLVFGVGRAFPGLLIIPSDKAVGMSKEELLDRVAPDLKIANERAEKFGQVSREMVEVLPHGTDYPRTDKGTMIRAACYQKFAELIDAVYVRFETPDEAGGPRKKLDREGLEQYLTTLFTERVGVSGLTPDTDFFDAGTDSLQAIAARGHIMRELDLGGHALTQNVVFEHPSIARLAAHLDALSNGTTTNDTQHSEIQLMRDLVAKYSVFEPFTPGAQVPAADVVLLTGATGSLGAHVLARLLALPHVAAVHCLVRAATPAAALDRVNATLASKALLPLPASATSKLRCHPSDLSQPTLGLPDAVLDDLKTSLTAIIHSAWAVNFNIGVTSFEAQHIRGVRHLLDLARRVPFARPARFSFISSISAAAGTPVPARIRETFVADPAHAQPMGYARSKWVAEHVVRGAATAAAATGGQRHEARVLRTGQIVGDTAKGLWNATEAIPLMLRGARTVGALPALDETPSWLPVDACAEAVVELSGVNTPFAETLAAAGGGEADAEVVFHVQNPTTFRWTQDLLPALKSTGLGDFEVVAQREWVRRLREESVQDPERNPTVKLVDFFAEKYDNDRPGRKGLVFETERTAERSKVIAEGVDVIGSGVVAKCVEEWMKTWA